MQHGETEDDREGRAEGGENHRDGEHLPLRGEQIRHEPEGRARADQQGLAVRPHRKPHEPGTADGVGEQDEHGGDPARGDRPQPPAGIGPAEGDVLHGDARAGQESIGRLPAEPGAAAGHPPRGGARDGDPRPGQSPRPVAEEEDTAQNGQRDTCDGAHGNDHTHRAVTEATVENAHGGGAAGSGQGAPQQVGGGDGVDDAAAEGRGQCEKGTHSLTGARRTGWRCRGRLRNAQAALAGCGSAVAHSWTRRWYSSRCSPLSVPPDRSHRARISSLTSAADRSEEGSTVVDMP